MVIKFDRMKKIYIIGSGGFAKEVVFLIQDVNKLKGENYEFGGFVDISTEQKRMIGKKAYPIIQQDEFLSDGLYQGASVAIGIGNPQLLEKLINTLKESSQSFVFPNLIHPSVVADWNSISVGEGNIVTANCIFTVDIHIGSFNIFNLSCTVGHDTNIGNFNVINPGVNISGGVTIGNRNLLGTNSTVLQYLSIGDDSIAGGTALITKNLESNLVAVGVPAKPVKPNLA